MCSKGIFNDQLPPEMRNVLIKSNTKDLADEIVNWPEVKKLDLHK